MSHRINIWCHLDIIFSPFVRKFLTYSVEVFDLLRKVIVTKPTDVTFSTLDSSFVSLVDVTVDSTSSVPSDVINFIYLTFRTRILIVSPDVINFIQELSLVIFSANNVTSSLFTNRVTSSPITLVLSTSYSRVAR